MRRGGIFALLLCVSVSCAGQELRNLAARVDTCRPTPAMAWQSLPVLVDRATLIVRAGVTRIETIDDGGAALRTITLRPREVLKGTAASEVTVIENACPFFDVRANDEWIAFLTPYSAAAVWPSPPLRTDATANAYLTLGGPEAVFAVRNGTITRAGSLDEMPAQLIRSYEGRLATQLLSDVRAVRPVDGDVRALFARSGWTPRATLYAGELTLPPAIGFQNMGMGAPGPGPKVLRNFDEFAAISRAGGLDFRPYASKPGELIQILLERDWNGTGRFPPVGHAIIVDRRIVGAWVLVLPQGDLYAPAQREAALAAPPHDPPPPTPIPNRFPHGVNLARDHGLAETFALSVKNPDLSGGQTEDRAVIGPIVEAFDVMLATEAPPIPRGGAPMIVLIWAGDPRMDRFFTLEYWPDDDVLVNRSFGYAVHPPRRAIELLRAVR